MPELPDLEVFRENLKPKIAGKKITSVKVQKPKILKKASVSDFKKALVGKKITEIKRRGKMLVFKLSSGVEFLVHLMLHGELHWNKSADLIQQETCAQFGFGRAQLDDLRFLDSTSWMKISLDMDELDKLGVEPLSKEFTVTKLEEILKAKQLGSVKDRLTDQKYIVGIGNAYVDEILWEAKIGPKRVASLLKDLEINSLHQAIQNTLKNAIKQVSQRIAGGITGEIRDFLSVHRKKECPECGSKVKRIELNKKGTYFCLRCQK